MANKITHAQEIWQMCDRIYYNKIRLSDGKKEIESKYGMKQSSFTDYYYSYQKMLDGRLHQRTIQTEIRGYMLERIKELYGICALKTALKAFMLHIEYYEQLKNITRWKDRTLYEKYNQEIINYDIKEQDDLISDIQKNTKQEIIKELKSIKATDSEKITIHSKVYSRDNKTVAQLKILRDYTCQICGTKILKADGTYYIEAAHITPKAQKGPELPNNILILCPNHHKEFDFGNLIILERDDKHIRFRLNNNEYTISLELK